MTSPNQRAELQAQIWEIANDVRGSVDGWDFKQFVLVTLFYRFISEYFIFYIEGGDESVNYTKLPDDVITPEIKENAIKNKGYLIYPSQLYANITKDANTNGDLNTDLVAIFTAIESSDNKDVEANDYNLSVNSCVEVKDTLEVINIVELNKEIATTESKIDALRVDIDAIIKEIETIDKLG